MSKCITCDGDGVIKWSAYVDGEGMQEMEMMCPDCDGSKKKT